MDGEWFSLDPTFHMKVVGFIFRWFIVYACEIYPSSSDFLTRVHGLSTL